MDQLLLVHHAVDGWDLSGPIILVTAENAATMASGQDFTRRSCLKGPHGADWIDAEFAKIDKHHYYGMYSPPLSRSVVPPSAKVVRNYS
jgi:hypothetical protein